MNIRETINQKPTFTAVIAAAICLAALLLVIRNLSDSRANARRRYADTDFFSDDDGKTWFIDDVSRLPPFDHYGKTAVRAILYRCGNGKPFVAYLGEYSQAQFDRMAELKKQLAQRDSGIDPQRIFSTIPMDVKKPGDSKWVAGLATRNHQYDSKAYEKVTTVVCSDGSGTPVMVQVSDSDVQ